MYILKQTKKPKSCITLIKHSGHLRTLDKCRKHSPAARVFYISLMFSNDHRVLSQCNTRLRLLYLLKVLEKSSRRDEVSAHEVSIPCLRTLYDKEHGVLQISICFHFF